MKLDVSILSVFFFSSTYIFYITADSLSSDEEYTDVFVAKGELCISLLSYT
jgi:hypothetical protein